MKVRGARMKYRTQDNGVKYWKNNFFFAFSYIEASFPARFEYSNSFDTSKFVILFLRAECLACWLYDRDEK